MSLTYYQGLSLKTGKHEIQFRLGDRLSNKMTITVDRDIQGAAISGRGVAVYRGFQGAPASIDDATPAARLYRSIQQSRPTGVPLISRVAQP